MVTMHHIVSDGWSLGILLRELGELYEGYASREWGKAGGVGGSSTGTLRSGNGSGYGARCWKSRLEYWREQLQGMAALPLPTDRVRGRRAELPGRRVSARG